MTFRPLASTNSDRTNWGQINDMIRDLNAKERVQIFKDDTGTRRVLLGKGASGFYGLKVSEEGVDVYTATDDQLIFNSSQNLFKIVRSSTGSVTVGSGDSYTTVTTTIPHGLNFTPIVLGFVDSNSTILSHSGRTPTPYTMYESVTTSPIGLIDNTLYVVIGQFTITADATNIYLNVGTHKVTFYTQLQGVWNFTYYVLQETAA